jgi:hypothetical protein
MGNLCSSGITQDIKEEFERPASPRLSFTSTKSPRSRAKSFIGEGFFGELVDKFQGGVDAVEHALFDFQKKVSDVKHKETCIPGVYTYNGVHEVFQEVANTSLKSELQVVLPTVPVGKVFDKLVGKKRTPANWKKAQEAVTKAILKHEKAPEIGGGDLDSAGGDAKVSLDVHFPEILDSKQMIEFMKHNPFFTAGMHFDEETQRYCFDATANSPNELNAVIFKAFPETWACSKMWFNKELTTCRVEVDGEEFNPDVHNKKLRPFITAATYHFEMLHAVLHVYLYVMLGAANQATFRTKLSSFIDQYEEQILIKYVEVAELLLGGKAPLLKGSFWNPIISDKLVDEAAKIIFEKMAACKNSEEWLDEIFLAGCLELQHEPRVLREAKKYQKMFVNLGSATMEAFEEQYNETESYRDDSLSVTRGLMKYLTNSNGTDFTMKTFKEWIECQGMAGILHGNTLGYTRLLFTDYVCPSGNWDTDVFGETFSKSTAAVGTLCGLKEEHAINQVIPVEETPFEGMMQSFQQQTEQMQAEFWNSLEEKDKETYAWCKSVWGPNMEDSTQLTITSYV